MDGSIREIQLTKGETAIVDADDYDRVSIYRWHVSRNSRIHYARRSGVDPKTGKKTTQYLHRFILDYHGQSQIDHIDNDGLNCRKYNLRVATVSQNQMNRYSRNKNNTSGYKGISWHAGAGRWRARVHINGRRKHIGFFGSPEAAAKAYDTVIKEMHGDFARLNFPDIA